MVDLLLALCTFIRRLVCFNRLLMLCVAKYVYFLWFRMSPLQINLTRAVFFQCGSFAPRGSTGGASVRRL